jgi:DNA-binding transcriptional MocR family regulator
MAARGPRGPYRPAPWLAAYAYHWARAIAERRVMPSQRELAAQCGVHESTVSAALARPHVQTWLTTEMRRYLGADGDVTERVLMRLAAEAMAGDLDAIRLWLQVQGRVGSGSGPTTAIQVQQTQVTLTPLIIRTVAAPEVGEQDEPAR